MHANVVPGVCFVAARFGCTEEKIHHVYLFSPHFSSITFSPGTNNHAGNVKFRLMVNGSNKLRYLAASKADKPRVAADVVKLWRALDPPGRFLARKDTSRKGPGSVKVWWRVSECSALISTCLLCSIVLVSFSLITSFPSTPWRLAG